MSTIKRLISMVTAASVLLTSFCMTVHADSNGYVVSSDGMIGADLPEIIYLDENNNPYEPNLIPSKIPLVKGNASSPYFNLYEEGRVTAIRNQNPLNTCWAYAALASAESSMITKGYATTNIDYSEAHLAWFANGPGPSSTDPLYGDSRGSDTITPNEVYNNGGHMYDSMGALSRLSGAELESVVPYTIATNLGIPDESKRYDSYATLVNTNIYDPSDMASIKDALVNIGAIQVSYYHDDKYLNPSTSAYYCNVYKANHAVTIVGWDDNFSKNNFNSDAQPTNNGAWIVKNSWGTNWGDEGFFYISYEDTSLCNVISYEMEKSTKYDKLYQYDGALGMTSVPGGSSMTGMKWFTDSTSSNVFTADTSEKLSAVGFYTIDASTSYKISIFTDVVSTPSTGTLVHTQSGIMTYAGYHVIDLSKAIQLTAGKKFAVAITFYGSSCHCFDNYSPSTGLSYIAYTTNPQSASSWTDAYTAYSSSACIKAFTSTAKISAPTNLKATAGDAKVTLTWNAVDGATNYAVLMKKGTEWITLGSTGTNTTYTATGLTNGGKYYFVVKAYGKGAWSANSDTVWASPMCIIPQNVKASAGDSKVTLTWDSVSGATNYAVFLRKGATWLKIGSSGTNTTFTSRGLENGGKYFYMVKAYVNGSWSDESKAVSAIPLCITPQNVKASAGDSKVTLTWDSVSGATNYAVFLRKGATWLKIGSSGTNTTFTSRGLENGGKYFYMVKAYVNGSWSDESKAVSAIPLCITPQNVKAKGSVGQAIITWDSVKGATNYAVLMKKGANWITLGSTGANVTYTATKLASGGKYYFVVKAYVNGAWSDESNVVSATIS